MTTTKAYDEIVDFIARGSDPQSVIEFRPSEEANAHVAELAARSKAGDLTAEESSELEQYRQLVHFGSNSPRLLIDRDLWCHNRGIFTTEDAFCAAPDPFKSS